MNGRHHSNTLEFKAALKAWGTKLGKIGDDVAHGMANIFAENIIVGGKYSPGTPVDTGRARGSWYPALNGQPIMTGNAGLGLASLDRAIAVFRKAKSGSTFELWTNVAYMPPLEYGHSKQAPVGMVRITIRNAQSIANEAAAQL